MYENLLERISLAQTASCTCLTKTPVFLVHKEDCRFRILEESRLAIQRLIFLVDKEDVE